MTITLNVDEILFDIANKSHDELAAAIPDTESRYVYEAGTEKKEDLYRCLTDALSRLHIELQRFCADPPYIRTSGDNTQEFTDGSVVVIVFQDTCRRRNEQIQSLAQVLHSYLANQTLAQFYENKISAQRLNDGQVTTGIAERLAQVHAGEAAASAQSASEYLYTKLRPTRTAKYDY